MLNNDSAEQFKFDKDARLSLEKKQARMWNESGGSMMSKLANERSSNKAVFSKLSTYINEKAKEAEKKLAE